MKEISPELLKPIPGPTNTQSNGDRNNNYAMGYSDIFMEMLQRRSAPRNAGHLLPLLRPGMTLLDLGCGPGSITSGLAAAVHPGKTHGVDLNEEQLGLARRQAQELGLENLEFHQSNALRLPFPDQHFDAIHCHGFLMHSPCIKEQLAEILRVLKPRGIQRWPQQRSLINHIKNHWFVMNQAGALRQDNTAGRTWWIANTAIKAAEASAGTFQQEEAIQHFANHPRHYHNMMDSNFSRHPLLCAELLRALMNEAKGIKVASSDHIWKRMNLNAGTLLLDAMPREEIRRIINEHVEAIMSKPEFVADRSKLRNRRPTRVLSLGAGVQSSCLALMADQGAYELPKPDFAIFADTGWEPQEVYDHLEWLEEQLSYDVIRVDNGNLRENILKGIMPDGSKFLGIPAYLTNPDGTSGILHRQCTTHYKTKPIHDYLKEYLHIQPRRRAPIDVQVEMWLGISTDEAIRQKPDREELVNKRYPLIELGFNRAQLLTWFNQNYPDRDLPSSSCIGCPYHSDSVWKQLKEKNPKSFQEAVFIDQALRNVPATKGAVKGDAYLHKSRIPLVEVDFSEATAYDDLMLEECEGLCGI